MDSDTPMNTVADSNPPLANTVLLVDDEEMVLEVGRAILQRLGYDVISALNGEDALARFGQHGKSIGCAVLDLTMPGMDGKTTFLRLRELRPDLPVIIASGLAVDQVAGQFKGMERVSIIQKPYQVADLAKKITESMQS
jgi:CheY-like chemotaxis protein